MTAKMTLPPALDELMTGFLARQSTAITQGAELAETSEIEAYDAVPAQAVDPRQAWDGALEALAQLVPGAKRPTRLPGGWSGVVASLPTATGLPMAVGAFPQAVRDVLPLVQARSFAETLPAFVPADDTMLGNFIDTCTSADEPMPWLIAAGLMRLTGRFEAASEFMAEKLASVPASLLPAWINEQAALAWAQGDLAGAIKLWETLPESAPALFNRGMAELFADRPAAARPLLKSAVAMLPDSSPWHHLGRLYLALAESR